MKAMDSMILSLLEKKSEGLSFEKLASGLRLRAAEKKLLRKRLKKLEGQGLVLRVRSRYVLPAKSSLVRGKFSASRRGYGFVSPEGGLGEDIFIPARYAGKALEGDEVEVLYREKGKKGKPEGRVTRIVNKGRERMVGISKERWGQVFFLPFDSPSAEEIPIGCDKSSSLRPGMMVTVDRQTKRLAEILGMPDDPGVDTRVVIERLNLSTSFSAEALAEAEECKQEISQRDIEKREDCRNWRVVTIDGENAQDFDDAVSIRKLSNGNFLLGVHIADVSHYVKPGSFLDREAYERGTSVYFPDLTLPMLPERLSNDICSLRPKEEKLTFSVLLELNGRGEAIRTELHPSLIKTVERMTYTSVFKIFEGDEEERQRFPALVPDLLQMRDLARVLKKRRKEQGGLDFDLLEPEIVYKEGNIHSVVAFERNEAHQVIEEFMVLANEGVAFFLARKNMPLMYRNHPPPALKDLDNLRELLAHFGLHLPPARRLSSKDLQRVLEEVAGKREEKFISLQVLKSLSLAVYSAENEGHYGLAKKVYTHFTSPIRRYPDLCVHRILKKALRREKLNASSLSAVALHCSERERKADEAERELLEWRIYRFLKGKLGEEFEGIIVALSKAGLIVELDGYFVDGLVSYADLDKDYYFKRSEKTLVGRKTGKRYELGDRLRVILASVDPILRRMSLVLSRGRKEESR